MMKNERQPLQKTLVYDYKYFIYFLLLLHDLLAFTCYRRKYGITLC